MDSSKVIDILLEVSKACSDCRCELNDSRAIVTDSRHRSQFCYSPCRSACLPQGRASGAGQLGRICPCFPRSSERSSASYRRPTSSCFQVLIAVETPQIRRFCSAFSTASNLRLFLLDTEDLLTRNHAGMTVFSLPVQADGLQVADAGIPGMPSAEFILFFKKTIQP